LIAYVPGKRGQAASFDGNSYIQIPDTQAFQSWKNRSVTLAAWVQVVDNGDYRQFITLSDTDAFPLVGIGKLSGGTPFDGRISLQVLDHIGNAVRIYSLDDGNTLPKKTWLHVVGVVDYENLQAKLYINGILQQVAKLGINVDMSQATSLTFLICALSLQALWSHGRSHDLRACSFGSGDSATLWSELHFELQIV